MLALLNLGVVFLDFLFNVLDLEELTKFMEAMQCFVLKWYSSNKVNQ